MRIATTFIFSVLSFVLAIGQTTITSSTFFEINDILYTATDNAPNVSIGTIGGTQTWDYSSLTSTQIEATEVFPASSGIGSATFPSADAYINVAGGELYVEFNTNNIKQIGFVGAMAGFDVNTAFSPQGNYKRAPINYQDSYTESNGIQITIAAEDIPFLDSLQLPINPDSIRVTQIFNTAYEADAYGMMMIPNGTYDVLRLKRIQTTETQIEAYVPILQWIDITDLAGGAIGGLGGFGGGALESYEFLADGIKEPIAVVNLDTVGGNIVNVTYKAQDTGTPISEAGGLGQVFSAYPNPAYSDVRIDIRGFDNGQYSLDVYNIAGKKMMSESLTINRDTAVTINVAHLDKGTYLYAIIDENGEIVRAKRLMVIKP